MKGTVPREFIHIPPWMLGQVSVLYCVQLVDETRIEKTKPIRANIWDDARFSMSEFAQCDLISQHRDTQYTVRTFGTTSANITPKLRDNLLAELSQCLLRSLVTFGYRV
jgi:hypothetical protein